MSAKFRVLLVNCNTPMDNLIPAGISVISALLKSEGFDVRLFDTTFYKPAGFLTGDEARMRTLQVKKTDLEEIGIHPKPGPITEDFRKVVTDYQPDLIGFSIIEVTYRLSLELLRAVSDYRRSALRVFGGVHATFAPQKLLAEDLIDVVCVGEGEYPMLELCRALRDGGDHTRIPNLWVRTNGAVSMNPPRPAVNLDALPDQDWEIYERERFWKPMGGKIWVTGTFEMNRGCPYSCLYCVNDGLNRLYEPMGGYYREKSIPVLIREMKDKKKRYGLQFAYLVAESFLTTTRERLAQFAELYPAEVGLPFWGEARPESVTKEKVRLLEACGCEGISLGVESGDMEFRKRYMSRDMTDEKLIGAFAILADSSLRVSANNVIGFPTETREMIFETIELNRKFPRVEGVMCALYNPYHGTRLRDVALEKGYIDQDTLAGDYRKETVMRMEHLTEVELLGLQRTFPLYVKFPKERWRDIKRAEAFNPEGDRAYDELSAEYRDHFMK